MRFRTKLALQVLMAGLYCPWPVAGAARAEGQQRLSLAVSVDQPSIPFPFPARLTLHLHNAGPSPLWLYRHARDPSALQRSEPAEESPNGPGRTFGGATLAVRLEPANVPKEAQIAIPAQARVLESVGLPHPRLVRVAPGTDYEEKLTVHLAPAVAQGDHPVWGRYRLAATYEAQYSNGADIHRNLGVLVWEGEVTSSPVEIELRPPTGEGTIEGSVIVNASGRPKYHELVSLSDRSERPLDQVLTGDDGCFSFTLLPSGLYWVTVRDPDSTVDTAVFRHAELTAAAPSASLQFALLPPETYEPKQELHKPVLVRVTDRAGKPVRRATLEIVWSSGTVAEILKAQVDDDGVAALELIPGRAFVTIKEHGCPKEDRRLDVAEGEGIDGFPLTLDCSRE
jgi:hypothetical protein